MTILSKRRCMSWLLGMSLTLAGGSATANMASNESAMGSASCGAEVTETLEAVGSTRLSVMFWDVYDATLFSDSGAYENAEQLALRLEYLRDIDAADLVETTGEEWEKLDYQMDDQAQQWLQQLNDMWPDVQAGDCITLVVNGAGESTFYGVEGRLGEITDAAFSERFLAIWLSAESRFEDERNELIGSGGNE